MSGRVRLDRSNCRLVQSARHWVVGFVRCADTLRAADKNPPRTNLRTTATHCPPCDASRTGTCRASPSRQRAAARQDNSYALDEAQRKRDPMSLAHCPMEKLLQSRRVPHIPSVLRSGENTSSAVLRERAPLATG